MFGIPSQNTASDLASHLPSGSRFPLVSQGSSSPSAATEGKHRLILSRLGRSLALPSLGCAAPFGASFSPESIGRDSQPGRFTWVWRTRKTASVQRFAARHRRCYTCRGIDVRRNHRHLWHGHGAGQNALEPMCHRPIMFGVAIEGSVRQLAHSD